MERAAYGAMAKRRARECVADLLCAACSDDRRGGTIPFMAMLGKHFPAAQFLITGVLGPKSNAHGPNEFLHIPYAKKLTACVAQVVAAHGAQS